MSVGTEATVNAQIETGQEIIVQAKGGTATVQMIDSEGVWTVIDTDDMPLGVIPDGKRIVLTCRNIPIRFSVIASKAFYY